jgi:hypothetical protein
MAVKKMFWLDLVGFGWMNLDGRSSVECGMGNASTLGKTALEEIGGQAECWKVGVLESWETSGIGLRKL